MSFYPSASVSPTQPQATPERPWLGLAHFTEADHDYFKGRDLEIRELTDRVRRAPLTILYGVSGYGKSSLLGAGLVPELRKIEHPVVLLRRCYDDLSVRPLHCDVLAACAAAIPDCQLAGDSDAVTLWEFFHDRGQPWFHRSDDGDSEAFGADEGPRWPVLLFDQFEEIFVKGEDRSTSDSAADARARDAARAFLVQLSDLVENRPPTTLRERLQSGPVEERSALARRYDFQCRPVRVALALRDDFLGRLERLRRAMPSLMEHRVELRLLSGPQAYKAVFEPGAKRPGQPPIISPDVARSIVRAAANAAPEVPLEEIDAVPPILSLLCEQLNEKRLAATPSPTSVTSDDFSSVEAGRILSRFYEAKFQEHPRALREFLEDKLVSDSGYRENIAFDTAVASLRSRVPDVETRLRKLVDDRVLVIEDRGGKSRVELSHDRLAALAIQSRQNSEVSLLLKRTVLQAALLIAVAVLFAVVSIATGGLKNVEGVFKFNAFSAVDIISTLVSGMLFVSSINLWWNVTRRTEDLLFGLMCSMFFMYSLVTFALDNVVPAKPGAWEVSDPGFKTLVLMRINYFLGFLMIPFQCHFALRFCNSELLRGWRSSWLYVVTIPLSVVCLSDSFLNVKSIPNPVVSSSWTLAVPYLPETGTLFPIFSILWTASFVFSQRIFWRHGIWADRRRDLAAKCTVLGVILMAGIGFYGIYSSFTNYQGIDYGGLIAAAGMFFLFVGITDRSRRTYRPQVAPSSPNR